MPLFVRPTPGEPVLTDREPAPRIEPTTRRKFTPAPLPEVSTDPASPIPAPMPSISSAHRGKGLLSGRFAAVAKSPQPVTPHLHPLLQDIELRETRAIPQLAASPDPQDTQFSQPTERVRELSFVSSVPTIRDTDEPPVLLSVAATQEAMEPLPVVDGMVVLYSQPNFTVSTAYRQGQKVIPLRKPSGHTTRISPIMPRQRERVAGSETRRMPRVDVAEIRRSATLPVPLWLEIAAVGALLVAALVLHGYNLFRFPAYTMDEGTYMQNAWAITVGKLSPYPYGYGHPPVGWMQIALWTSLTGLFRFGSSIDSGRVLMLFYAAGDMLLVYGITRHLGGSKSAALFGLTLFAFSPLSVILQREVLLDNIATFWLLLALYLIVVSRSRLLYLIGAALALGLAILSKEVLAVCVPAMIYAAWLHTTPFQRKFALVTFIYITLALISTFVLLALLKDEFFPAGWHLPWDAHPHLSLLDTYIGQVQRGQSQGSLAASWHIWTLEDAPLLFAGIAAPAFNVFYGWRNRKHLLLGLLALSYWLLIVRGGVVYVFYLLPLIPLIALNVALALHILLDWSSRMLHVKPARAVTLLLLLSLLLPYDTIGMVRQASAQPVLAQQQALTWVRTHVPRNAYVVVDAYMYLDLRQDSSEGEPFTRAEVYWNVATDPAIRVGVLHNDWNTIDYLVVDDQMLYDMQANSPEFALLQQALTHADLLASFHASDQIEGVTLRIYQVRHENTPLV